MVDIATRVHDHRWKIDPIVRSLIDDDFYKLLMCQSVLRNRPDTQVTFSLINRSTEVPLAELVDEGELREQLDHVRTLQADPGRRDVAARQHVLRQAADVPPGFHGMVRGDAAAALSPGARRRPVRADLRGPVARGDAVGDPGAGGADGAALARGAGDDGPVRAAGALRPGDDQALGEDRAAAADRGPQDRRFRHQAAAFASCGRTGACRR